jgi:hypothetical protein
MDAESQVMMNAPIEHNFQDAFTKGRSAENGVYAWKGTTSRVMVASRPKVSFDQMMAPVPEMMDVCSIGNSQKSLIFVLYAECNGK